MTDALMKTLRKTNFLSLLIPVSILIVALSVAYYLVIFLPKYKTAQLELTKITKSEATTVEATQPARLQINTEPTTKLETKQDNIPTATNNDWEKQDCLKRLQAFQKLATSQGYSQDEINAFVEAGKTHCETLGPPPTMILKIK